MKAPFSFEAGLTFGEGSSHAFGGSFRVAASAIAFTICVYPVHRQRLPEIDVRISSSVGEGFRARRSFALINIPGVQNPQWTAS